MKKLLLLCGLLLCGSVFAQLNNQRGGGTSSGDPGAGANSGTLSVRDATDGALTAPSLPVSLDLTNANKFGAAGATASGTIGYCTDGTNWFLCSIGSVQTDGSGLITATTNSIFPPVIVESTNGSVAFYSHPTNWLAYQRDGDDVLIEGSHYMGTDSVFVVTKTNVTIRGRSARSTMLYNTNDNNSSTLVSLWVNSMLKDISVVSSNVQSFSFPVGIHGPATVQNCRIIGDTDNFTVGNDHFGEATVQNCYLETKWDGVTFGSVTTLGTRLTFRGCEFFCPTNQYVNGSGTTNNVLTFAKSGPNLNIGVYDTTATYIPGITTNATGGLFFGATTGTCELHRVTINTTAPISITGAVGALVRLDNVTCLGTQPVIGRTTNTDSQATALSLNRGSQVWTNRFGLWAGTNTAPVLPANILFTNNAAFVTPAQRSQLTIQRGVALVAASAGLIVSNATDGTAWSNAYSAVTVSEEAPITLPIYSPSQSLIIYTNANGFTITRISLQGL